MVTVSSGPSISRVSLTSTSSPLASTIGMPISPPMNAAMPASLSARSFTVNESKAKLCEMTPGLPAFAWAPTIIIASTIGLRPVDITMGLG